MVTWRGGVLVEVYLSSAEPKVGVVEEAIDEPGWSLGSDSVAPGSRPLLLPVGVTSQP